MVGIQWRWLLFKGYFTITIMIIKRGKRENKMYICSNQITMKQETCVSVDKFSDVSKIIWVET